MAPQKSSTSESERRVLVVAPTKRDGEVTRSLLHGSGLECVLCGDLAEMCSELPHGAGALLMTSHVLASPELPACVATLEAQPSWSDLPIVMLLHGAAISERTRTLLQSLGNVTLLENPAPARSVVSAVQTAVRSRLRQYLIRDQLAATERAEAHSRQLQEQLSIALEASELGTFHCPLPIGPVVWNARCKEHFGLGPDETIDIDRFYSLLHPEDRDRTRAAVEACINHRAPYDVEYRVPLANGDIRWIRATGKTFYDVDNRPVRLDGTTKDITDRKEAEAQLQKHAERQQLLSEAAEVLLSAADPVSMMQRLFGRVSEQLGIDTYFNFIVDESGRALRLVSCLGLETAIAAKLPRLEFGQAVCGTVAATGRPLVATHVQSSDEATVQMIKGFGIRSYACNPLIADGQLIGTLSFASHVRDEFDDAEVTFFETISRYVTMAYVRLRLVEQLREADRRKDEFLATLAHELRNPLAPISSGLQLLRLAGSDPQTLSDTLGIMERQLAQMVRLIDDLLDLSRITRNKLPLRKETFNLSQALRDALETSRPMIEAAGHELVVTLPEEPVLVKGDRVRLAQVFGNLLNNAGKYTERGGRIEVTAQRLNGEAVISVRDTGIGIAPEHRPHVFEMFSQVAPAIERSQGGLGIGLALVQGLVHMHGGRVEVQSQGVGMGSEFIVRLPVVGAKAVQGVKPASRPTAAASAPRRRVLVVDDNLDAATTMAMVVKRFGHDVHMVHDGEAAVEAAVAQRPDIVLLDIGLPKLNGYEVCRRIRQRLGGDAITLVALTGWGQDEDKRKAADAGFDHHFTKPVDTEHLKAVLSR